MKTNAALRAVTALEGILACIGFFVVVGIAYTGDQKKTFDLMESYAEGISNGISTFFTDAAAVASAAATLNSVQELDWSVAGLEFMGFIRSNPYIHRMSLADSSGFIYDAYATGPAGNPWQGGRRTENNAVTDSPPVTIRGRDYFRILVEENTAGEFFVLLNEPFVPVGMTEKAFVTSAPVIRDGQAVGTVSVAQTALELSMLYEDLSMDFLEKFGRDAHMYLVSEGEQLISSLEYNESYGAYMDKLFGSTETVSVFTLGQDTVSAIDEAVRHDKRVVSANMMGSPHLVVGSKIERTPFAVCLAASRSYMLKTSRAILASSSILFVLSLLGVIAGAILMRKERASPQDNGQDESGKHSPQKRHVHSNRRFRHAEDIASPVLPPDDSELRT